MLVFLGARPHIPCYFPSLFAGGCVVLPRVNGLLFQFATRPARTTRIPALLETSPGLDLCSAH